MKTVRIRKFHSYIAHRKYSAKFFRTITVATIILSFPTYAGAGGESKMERYELINGLKLVNVNDEEKLEAVSKSILMDIRAPLDDVAHVWGLPDEEMSAKAAFMLDEFKEFAIDSLLRRDDSKDIKKEIWRISTIVEAELMLRTRIAGHLDKLLDDRTPVPMPDMGPIEEPPPPRRVCDEAYVLMRQLLNASESREQQLMNIEEFLNFPEKEKDAEIAKVRKSKKWTEFLEDIDMEKE